MKRWIIFTFKLLLAVMIISPFTIFCAAEEPQKPEKVYSIIYIQKPNDWYIKQAELWKKKIDKNPKDNEAWHNYYNAVRYARFTETIDTKEKKEKLNHIIAEMGKAIPGSFEYHYLKHKTNCDLWGLCCQGPTSPTGRITDRPKSDRHFYARQRLFVSHFKQK